jgi:signal transduction histidine kinase
MNSLQGEPTVLKAPGPRERTPSYPWLGLLLGAGTAVLLAYPLVLMINLMHDHYAFGVPLNLFQAILRGLGPQLWPLIGLYALGGALGGAIVGRIFQRIHENRLRLDNLHHEFELQVTALRHHYKNLALGIQGFSNRIRRKMNRLEQHFQACVSRDCLTYSQFYQDFEALQQSVAILEDTSQRLTHTLGQELLFLRALTSNTPAMEPQDFYPFLEHCVRDLTGLRFRDKEVRVEINGRPLGETRESLILSFDPHILEVVLQNILTNAMKSGDYLQIRVQVDHDLVRVEVEDNGPGLDLADVQRQLTLVNRGRDAESTYLGLKVSLHLLEKCHGRLLARSRPGNGATFIVEFPRQHQTLKLLPPKEAPHNRAPDLGTSN